MISKKQLILLLLALVIGMGVGSLVFNNYQETPNYEDEYSNYDPMDDIINEFMHAPDPNAPEKTLGDEANEPLHQSHESSHQELLNRMKRKKPTNPESFLPDDPADEGPLDYVDYLAEFKVDEKKTSQDFREALNSVYQKIPTIEQIKELPPKELHHMPRPLQVMGIYMGDLKEILKQRHDFYSEGMRYYRNCALNPQFMSAIRSLCLANLIEFGDEREDGLEGRYPKEIIDLAMEVRQFP